MADPITNTLFLRLGVFTARIMRNRLREWLLSRAIDDVSTKVRIAAPVFSSYNKEHGEIHIAIRVENYSFTEIQIADAQGVLVQGDDIPLVPLVGGISRFEPQVIKNENGDNEGALLFSVSINHFFWLQTSAPYLRVLNGTVTVTGSFGQAVLRIPDKKSQPTSFKEVHDKFRSRTAALLKDLFPEEKSV